MNFLYPRVVSIVRQPVATGGGVQPYGGMQPSEEVTLYTGLPASIQLAKERGKPEANLPADAGKTLWKVLMPLSAGVTVGSVLRGDIVTDDAGQRYQVWAPYINSLGPNFLVERLEA
jgi:hypothetical protein